MDSLEGKTAVVTGGGSGMGRSVALRLARAGSNVVVSDIVEPSAEAVADEARRHGVGALAVTSDVADAGANDALLDATIDEGGERWFDISERTLSTGLDPDVVGEQVHDAILANRFWLFTDDLWFEAIDRRTQAIVGGEPPPIGFPSRPEKAG